MVLCIRRLYDTIFLGIQAPSTANENPDDPILTIGGVGTIDATPLEEFLPQRLFIRVKYRPVACTLPTSIQLLSEEGQPLTKSLYADNSDILEALELINTGKNSYDLKDASFSLDAASPFQCTQELIFRMPFQTLKESRDVDIAHEPLPYGGNGIGTPPYVNSIFFKLKTQGIHCHKQSFCTRVRYRDLLSFSGAPYRGTQNHRSYHLFKGNIHVSFFLVQNH